MKLSLRAFKDWVDYQGSAHELANLLADLGFPNDGIQFIGEGLDQVIVGKVLAKAKHPQADRLSLLKVDVGSEVLPIVCGANNMEVSDWVALAPIGAKIPGKDGSGIVMKEAKIRGEISKGMCCSEVELRLSEEAEGILILPKDLIKTSDIGRKVSEVLDLQDAVIDVDVTPNRGDALSIRGLAREVSAKLGLKMRALSALKWKNPVSTVNPSIESFSDASSFAACLVQGVQYKSSPEKWVRFLKTCGARSISNLVDITNIVMFELGHPIHFFDADKVDPLSIGVRRARENESLLLLNGKVIQLTTEDLVIADRTGPLSLAGVMGGELSAVSETTKNILIEVASFDPKRIRATARRYELHSESSARFERGVTAYDTAEVMERALELLKELSNFEAAAGTQTSDKTLQPKSVLWDRGRIEAKLGKISRSDDELFEMLRRLEYSFEPKGSTIRVVFPPFRSDVGCLEDVMEDIGRLLGYEALEKKIWTAQESKVFLKDLSFETLLSDQVLDAFIALGFSESIHLSFTNPALEQRFGYQGDDFVTLENPIHSEKSSLRRFLLPELMIRAKINAEYGEDDIRLVEVGPIFSDSETPDRFDESPKSERLSIACVWLPKASDKKQLWMRDVDPFFEFKGMMESIWSRMKARLAKNIQAPAFYPRRMMKMSNGLAGEVHPALLKSLEIPGRCFVGEWILQGQIPKTKYKSPQVYPAIDLDASFSASKDLSIQEVMESFQRAKAPFLEWVRPYDIFEPEDLKPNKRSLTFAMRYRDSSRTLTLEEAKSSHDRLVSTVVKELARFEIALR
jgi:phenylalanyl-tRNA synthetase beta chain